MNLVTSASLRYPLSVFNKNSTLKAKEHQRYTERRSDNFRRSQDESQSDGNFFFSSHMFLCPRRLKVNKGEKYNHSRPLHASTQATAGTYTHLASNSVGVVLSPQAQDFLNRPQFQCAASRTVCIHTCFQRSLEFQDSIVAADSSAPFLIRVYFCLLIRSFCSTKRVIGLWGPPMKFHPNRVEIVFHDFMNEID